MSQPETGALITEYDAARRRGPDASATCARTGHEDDRELHLALNSGIPLVDPTGGFFFVFQTGEPVFRKYDAAGQLRVRAAHAGARDRPARRQPADQLAEAADRAKARCRWSRRRSAPPRSTPPAICGSSFVVPYTYVYDRGRRQGPDGPVPRRGSRAEQPVLRQERPRPRDARSLRIRDRTARRSSASMSSIDRTQPHLAYLPPHLPHQPYLPATP